MFTLVIGGAASGKSEYAESLLCQSPAKERYYIATMCPFVQECEERILKHRAARAGRNFTTIERYLDLSGLRLPKGCHVLLECMSNLVANEVFDPMGAGNATVKRVLEGVERLAEQARELVVVSNEVFSDGEDYDPSSLYYLEQLGKVNQGMAQMADRVVEVVYTIPVIHKGGVL